MRAWSASGEPVALTKSQLRAAVDAVDQWVENNKLPFDVALSLETQMKLTPEQKARLLLFVVERRLAKGV
jgi:hypothetical protein